MAEQWPDAFHQVTLFELLFRISRTVASWTLVLRCTWRVLERAT